MHRWLTPRLLAPFALALFATSIPIDRALGDPPKAQAEPQSAAASAGDEDWKTLLSQGMERERRKDWAGALQTYERALEKFPGQADLVGRRRLCEIHHKLGRRYQDRSFTKVLLSLSSAQAERLYQEVLEHLETNYVEPVPIDRILRRGLDNLEVALRDATFLRHHLPNADEGRIEAVRKALRSWRSTVSGRTTADALSYTRQVSRQIQSELGLSPTATTLEFTAGACDGLDTYSSYLTPDKLEDLYALIDGNFVGVGVELKYEEDALRLVGVIGGGPAAQAGLRAGDRITHIDRQPLVGLNLDNASSRLQGEEGTTVHITIARENVEPRDITLVRRAIEVESVAIARMVDINQGIGYIRLIGFQRTSSDELRSAITRLNAQGMRYLILDVRDNPGGLLNVAIEIADQFLDAGKVIVSTRGRATGQTVAYRDHTPALWRMPVAILIDHDSASASEILAGALKENNRATVLGERSYGKGSVQSIFNLRTAPAGLKLTTAKFFSPTDRAYQDQGVSPDVPVRTVAKPGDRAEFGDLVSDTVLRLAIRQATERIGSKSQTAAAQ